MLKNCLQKFCQRYASVLCRHPQVITSSKRNGHCAVAGNIRMGFANNLPRKLNYSTNSEIDGEDGNTNSARLVSNSSESTVDVDKEMERYNVEEFYPEESDGESSDEEIEEFGDFEMQSPKIVDVDKELERYNIDEFYGIELEEQHIKPVPEEEQLRKLPFELKRGVNGVFDVGELCALLEYENMWNVCAIYVPKEYSYVNHIVIGSGSSKRHLKAVAQQVKSIFKKKRDKRDRKSIYIEGIKEKAEDWLAVDLGNIALHLMLEETREKYDLETLWTCGPEYDTISKTQTVERFELTSPSELPVDGDKDDLFVELARSFSQKHKSEDVFKFGVSSDKPGLAWSKPAEEKTHLNEDESEYNFVRTTSGGETTKTKQILDSGNNRIGEVDKKKQFNSLSDESVQINFEDVKRTCDVKRSDWDHHSKSQFHPKFDEE